MRLVNNIPVWGEPLENAVEQMENCAKDAEHCALMADHHLGYSMPIGGVIAYNNAISPSGVGYDIACGNKAVMMDMVLRPAIAQALVSNANKLSVEVIQTVMLPQVLVHADGIVVPVGGLVDIDFGASADATTLVADVDIYVEYLYCPDLDAS